MGAVTGDMRQETGAEDVGPAKLDAWRFSDELALEVFKVSRRLPADLRWLSSQIVRAATSVPANISEGYSRSSKKEFLQFLSIARGSLAELEYFLHFLNRAGLMDDDAYARLADLRKRVGRTLFGLAKSVRSRLASPDGPHAALRDRHEEYLLDG